jgi:hypothetical protein
LDKEKILDQLVEFYNQEEWHQGRIPDEVARRTYEVALDKGNLILSLDSLGNLMGYCEYWKLNFEQLGRLLCKGGIDISLDDITNGNIAWVAGVFIKPEFRSSIVIDYLKTEFFKKTFRCEYFVGEARRKRHAPLKVFSRQEFYEKYAKKELVKYG